MILWRISGHADLSGRGGLVVDGRWSLRGRAIVYAAESSALAMLEVLVGYEAGRFPDSFQLLRIAGDAKVAATEYAGTTAPPLDESRAWGNGWLASGTTALASVPSAIAPESRNWLVNPAHPDAAHIHVTAKRRWPWDQRLFR